MTIVLTIKFESFNLTLYLLDLFLLDCKIKRNDHLYRDTLLM